MVSASMPAQRAGDVQGEPRPLSDADMKGFHEKIRNPTGKQFGEEVEAELAAVMEVADRIHQRKLEVPGVPEQINFILDCLMADKPRLILAREQRAQLQLALYQNWIPPFRWLARMSAGNSLGVILTGAIVSFAIFEIILFLVHTFSRTDKSGVSQQVFFMNGQALLVITAAAFVGALVSIAMRWREFARVRDVYPSARFFTLMFKPLIGVAMAIFILAALESGFVKFAFFPDEAFKSIDSPQFQALFKVDPPPASDMTLDQNKIEAGYKTLYLLWVFGFLAGFSERFASDFVGRAEGIASGKDTGKGKGKDKAAEDEPA